MGKNQKSFTVGAVVVAAGAGKRMGPGVEKLFLPLGGIPLIAHCLVRFQECGGIAEIVLVTGGSCRQRMAEEIVERYRLDKVRHLVEGGERRQDSVYNGLRAFGEPPDVVLIHDAARPFLTVRLIEAILQECSRGGAIAAVKAKDTVKQADPDGTIRATIPRGALWLAQTPQGFPYRDILEAHRTARERGWEVTDDAELIERRGGKVKIVGGDYDNIKIATPEDWELARLIQDRRSPGSR